MVAVSDTSLTLADFDSIDGVFALRGEDMRTHKGRGVIRVQVDGRNCYLKRYWLAASQVFQRHVTRGFHELRMIDWLNDNGFAGPNVVARGSSGVFSLATRLFFLMEEVPDEMPLEQTWWKMPESCESLMDALATFAAKLHDAGFVHTDFSERHIFVGRPAGGWHFRLIDVERARVGQRDDRLAAADLKTLAASIADQKLRERIGQSFLDDYIARRRTLSPSSNMRTVFANASPTRRF